MPYEVKCKYYNVYENCYEEGTVLGFERKEYIVINGECTIAEEVRPYLFPLSSMTEEQKEDMIKSSCGIGSDKNVFDWWNKNHFDYHGLIPLGLANDATGLNIY
jgi:hypothetical protein